MLIELSFAYTRDSTTKFKSVSIHLEANSPHPNAQARSLEVPNG